MTRLAATAADSAVPTAKPPKKFFQDARADANHDWRGAETRRRRHRQCRFDAVAQMRRRGFLQLRLRKSFAHGAERLELLRASGAGGHMGLDVAGMAGVELAVDERVQQDFGFVAVHGDPSSAFHAERSMERARASRDITVPTGAPTTSAISR